MIKWFIESVLGYTVINPDQGALVSKKEGFELLLPLYKDDEQIPVNHQFLTALYLRTYEDSKWCQELYDWWIGTRDTATKETGGDDI